MREVLDRVVAHFAAGERPGDDRWQRSDEKRVAVGSGLCDLLRAKRGARARLVLDDDGLLEAFAQLRAEEAGNHVGRSSRRERTHEPYRSAGIFGLGKGEKWHKGEEDEQALHVFSRAFGKRAANRWRQGASAASHACSSSFFCAAHARQRLDDSTGTLVRALAIAARLGMPVPVIRMQSRSVSASASISLRAWLEPRS